MRESLRQTINQTLSIEFCLPSETAGLDKSCLSTIDDTCLRSADSEGVAKIIYNGLIEFAVNEYKIDYENIDREQRKALMLSIRYDAQASEETRIKYGFYGEVLLDLVLRNFFHTDILLARGYLYSPIENAEVKGFDAFHLTEEDGKIDLWLGEAKFYQDYKAAISSVLKKIAISLSDSYVHRNLLALIQQKENLTNRPPQVLSLFERWENDPEINLATEMQQNNLRITYPIFIIYEQQVANSYVESIRNCITHISDVCTQENIQIPGSFDYRICFIFLPITEVKATKKKVLEWIESKEPLI